MIVAQFLVYANDVDTLVESINKVKEGKVHPCTGTEALYRPCGP